MKLKIWQVDAFASKPLEGNPAAIVPLERWLETALMQRIAAENNVAETAFFVKTGAGRLRSALVRARRAKWICAAMPPWPAPG